MKRLYRSENDKIVCGVCGGVAEYYNIDPSLVRIGVVVGSIILGAGIGGLIAYLSAAAIIPSKNNVNNDNDTDTDAES
jgi:phage shock protein C